MYSYYIILIKKSKGIKNGSVIKIEPFLILFYYLLEIAENSLLQVLPLIFHPNNLLFHRKANIRYTK